MTQRPAWLNFLSRLPNVTTLVLVAVLLVLYFAPFADLDFGILIRLGELIVRTGQLRPPESFSYTINGANVPDFEWLFEIVLYYLWIVFGYGGLKLLKVLLVGATLVVTGLHLRSEGVRWHGIALALGLGMLIVPANWNLRPFYFTTLGLLLVSWWLRDHCTGKRPLTWWLVPVMLLWANVHPGVITGQGLLAGAIIWEWLNHWIKLNSPLDRETGSGVVFRPAAHESKSRQDTAKNDSRPHCGLYRLTLIGGLGLAATFLSPDPIERLEAPFRPELRHPIQSIYVEMAPLYRVALEPPYLPGLAYVVAALVLVTIIFRFREYRLWEIALLIGLAGLANLAVRSLQDWVLVMLSLGVPHLARMLRAASRQRRRAPVAFLLRVDRKCKALLLSPLLRFQWRWPVAVLAVLAVVSLIPPLGRDMPIQARDLDPVRAVDWMEAHLQAPEPWRVFGPPDYGTYLVWRLGDRVRDYVDTRGFCFPPELTEDGHFMLYMERGWEERLERVLAKQTQFFLLEKNGGRANFWHWLRDNHAQPVYEDNQAVLLTAAEVRRVFLEWKGKNNKDN